MSEFNRDRESEPPGRPTHADLRADYDDDFGRVRTPRQIVRRRLLIPAIDFLVLGICGLIATLISVAAVLAEFIEDAADPLEYLVMVGLLLLCSLGGGLSTLIVIAGDGMLRLRRHRLALIASYFVTALSLGTIYAILFYPFGIWALVLLHKSEVRSEFDRVIDPSEVETNNRRTASKRSKRRDPPMMGLVIGGLGVLLMLFLCFLMIRMGLETNRLDDSEILGPIGLALIVALGFAFVFLRGIQVYRRFQTAPQSAERAERDDVQNPPEAGEDDVRR